MKTIKTIPFRWTLAVILFFSIQSHAWAHAFLDHADPKVGSTITTSPTQVKIWFTQNVEPVFSSIEVQDAQGQEVDKKDLRRVASAVFTENNRTVAILESTQLVKASGGKEE